jgi:hypothetical protein
MPKTTKRALMSASKEPSSWETTVVERSIPTARWVKYDLVLGEVRRPGGPRKLWLAPGSDFRRYMKDQMVTLCHFHVLDWKIG